MTYEDMELGYFDLICFVMTCFMMICFLQAPAGMRVDIHFDQQFGIEEHFEEKCVYDWIEVSFELVLYPPLFTRLLPLRR